MRRLVVVLVLSPRLLHSIPFHFTLSFGMLRLRSVAFLFVALAGSVSATNASAANDVGSVTTLNITSQYIAPDGFKRV